MRSEKELIKQAIEILKSGIENEAKMNEALAIIDKIMPQLMPSNKEIGIKINRFTKERLSREMQIELDRRIISSVELIKLGGEAAKIDIKRRIIGWASAGADKDAGIEKDVRDIIKELPFEQRRCIIDQGHKLVGNIANIKAVGEGAIALKWHSQFKRAGYNYRPEHKQRDGKIYLIRGSWADKDGLVRGDYYDTITAVNEEPYCSCYAEYIFKLDKLPKENVV